MNSILLRFHHPTMDHARTLNTGQPDFFGPEDPSCSLKGMVSAGIYVWNSRKLVLKDGKASVWSRKSHILWTLFALTRWWEQPPSPATCIQLNRKAFSLRISPKFITNLEPVEINTAGELSILDALQPTEIETIILRASMSDDNNWIPCPFVSSIARTTSLSRSWQILIRSQRCQIFFGRC